MLLKGLKFSLVNTETTVKIIWSSDSDYANLGLSLKMVGVEIFIRSRKLTKLQFPFVHGKLFVTFQIRPFVKLFGTRTQWS